MTNLKPERGTVVMYMCKPQSQKKCCEMVKTPKVDNIMCKRPPSKKRRIVSYCFFVYMSQNISVCRNLSAIPGPETGHGLQYRRFPSLSRLLLVSFC